MSGQPPTTGRRALPWVLGACGCALVLVIAIGAVAGGLWFAASRGGDGTPPTAEAPTTESPTTEQPTTEKPTFRVASPMDPPTGDAEALRAVLEDNPVLDVSLSPPESCDVPTAKGPLTVKQLQAFLDAAAPCLDRTFSSGFSDQNLPWHGPDVVAYTWPHVPEDATCDKDSFSKTAVRYCLLDETIYWPTTVAAGTGTGKADATETTQLYYFQLALVYGSVAEANSSLVSYYTQYLHGVEGDEDLSDEATRRFRAQVVCLGAAAAGSAPGDLAPGDAVSTYEQSEGTWTTDDSGKAIAVKTTIHWVGEGLEADGDLGACNTWAAPAEQVA